MVEFQHERFEHRLTFALVGHPTHPKKLSPDGHWLITAPREDRFIQVWNTQIGQLNRSWSVVSSSNYPGRYIIDDLAITADGKILVTGGKFLKAWELETGKLFRTFKGSSSCTSYINISSDSRYLVTEGGVGVQGQMMIWDLPAGKKIRARIGTITVKWVMSPDSKIVVGEDYFDSSIKVWDLITGETLHPLDNRYAIKVCHLTFSRDGKLLAGGGFDGIKIWDCTTGQQVQRVEKVNNIQYHQHLDNVYNLIFSPDGKTLLSSGSDGLIQVWDVSSGKNIGTIKGQNSINQIAMSYDGQILVGFGMNADYQSIVEVWETSPLA